jgi:hypothetical protein
MLDLDALNPVPERVDERVADDALVAMVGKFALWLVGIGAFFGLGVAALTGGGSSDEPAVVHVARAAHAQPASWTQPVERERKAAAEPKAKPLSSFPSSQADIDARHRELMAASERDQQVLAEAAKRGESMVQAEDGSWVPKSFYDKPAKKAAAKPKVERKASSSSSCKAQGKVRAEDGSCVPRSFYDRPARPKKKASGGSGSSKVSEDSPQWRCATGGNRVCGPGNSEGATPGCYRGGVLVEPWNREDHWRQFTPPC